MRHVLVIGGGSIGERHVRTFLATGRVRVTVCEPRRELRERLNAQYGVLAVGAGEEVGPEPIHAEVIATPAPLHVSMALRALSRGRHVLIEKPLALTPDRIAELIAARDHSRCFAAVAYIHHQQPTLRAAREFLQSGKFGAVRHAIVAAGHDFAAARPAYREIYYRDHALGGGAIQDALTHLVNVVEWVLGPSETVFCDAAHQVLVGVEVEDAVNICARNAGALVSYSLNQFQAPEEIRLDFHAEKGTVRVELTAQRWGTFDRGAGEWTWHPAPRVGRDELFVAQAHAFLDGCDGQSTMLCSLEEGLAAVRFSVAAFRSLRERRAVSV